MVPVSYYKVGKLIIGDKRLQVENHMGRPLVKLSISGFKSIREVKDFELGNLNIVVGAGLP